MDALRITALPGKLIEYTDQPVPSHRKLREGAVDAKFPAHQVNGIWHYNPVDLPKIAAAYGLSPKAMPARRGKASAGALPAAA